MSGTSPVGTWTQTNITTQTPQVWFGDADSNFAVATRFADNFAPHPAASPNMTVIIDAGFLTSISPVGQQIVTEQAQQTVTISAAPIAPNNRIDLISVSLKDGTYTYTAGTPATSPVAPALPVGQMQICQVSVPNGTVAITSSAITDLRAPIQPSSMPWAITTNVGDAFSATYTPGHTSLTDGLVVFWRASAANTTATPSLNIDGQGAKTITRLGGAACVAGDIPGSLAECITVYNAANTRWELLNPAVPKIPNSGVTAASYTNANITVGADGRITAASNGVKPFTSKFTSSNQAIPGAGGTLTVAHGLSVRPFGIVILLQCQTAEAGYSPGDTLVLPSLSNNAQYAAFQAWIDTTNVNLVFNSSGVLAINAKSTGSLTAITPANWQIIVQAWV